MYTNKARGTLFSCSAAAAGSASASLGVNDGVEIEFFMILAATMLRSTTWSIVTAHIDDNELYEDLLVNITKDVFSSTKTSVLASQRALRVNGPSQRPEWIPTLDGPYGGVNMRRFESCSQVVVVAGGSGAGWTIPFILAHLRRVDLALSFGRHIELPGLRVILATRDAATQNWYEQMVQSVVSSHAAGKMAECLEIDIFFTGVRPTPEKSTTTTVDTADLESSGGEKQAISQILTTRKETFSVRHHQSRPHLASVVRQEVESASATRRLGFFICGPLSMQGELANATASEQLRINDGGCGDIHLHIEQFSWA